MVVEVHLHAADIDQTIIAGQQRRRARGGRLDRIEVLAVAM